MERCSIVSTVGMVRHQDAIYQYQNGVICMVKLVKLDKIFAELEQKIKIKLEDFWEPMIPTN